jgi:hypothetical protein
MVTWSHPLNEPLRRLSTDAFRAATQSLTTVTLGNCLVIIPSFDPFSFLFDTPSFEKSIDELDRAVLVQYITVQYSIVICIP